MVNDDGLISQPAHVYVYDEFRMSRFKILLRRLVTTGDGSCWNTVSGHGGHRLPWKVTQGGMAEDGGG